MLDEKIRYAKLLLLELKEGPLPWSELEKKMVKQCGTHWKFVSLMKWLTNKGYIIKEGSSGSRAPYRFNSNKVEFDKYGNISIKF